MGEFELLARIRERLPAPGPRVRIGSGDDAAVTVPGGATATSVDALVDGVHFRLDRTPLRSVGHKALAAGLSDLAAMGAEPGEAYLVLGVPTGVTEEDALELLEGALALAKETGTTIAGGDVTRAPALSVAVTAVGHAASEGALVSRAGAKAGDLVAVTGSLGGAAAGLLLLERPDLAGRAGPEAEAEARRRQLEPHPRLAAGMALARAGATAMIDISDGLGADAGHVAERSSVAVAIDAQRLPLDAAAEAVAAAAGEDPLVLAASGGEDYELLACVPREVVDQALRGVEDSGTTLTVIGEVGPGSGVSIRLASGRLMKPSGFDQLQR
jgi:thiamine-monophosphate kinase